MFKVLKSFSGKVSGSKGHVIELKDKAIISDLLKAGYIEEDANIEASEWALKQIYLIQSNYKFINAVKFFRYGERPY